jgi:multiple sugar transport system permease protein
VALLLARKFRFQTLVRLAYVMPLMTAGIVVAVTWRALFDISSGWIDWFLSLFGIAPVDWLSDPSHAIVAIVISDAWVGVPFMAILLLAGLLAVPREPVEAAMVDGATAFQLFRYVTLPAIAPVVEIAIIFRTIDAFRKFELIQVLTGGGPGVSTTTLNYQIYQLTFNEGRLGYGAAMAVLLVGLIVLFVGIVTIFRIRRARGA